MIPDWMLVIYNTLLVLYIYTNTRSIRGCQTALAFDLDFDLNLGASLHYSIYSVNEADFPNSHQNPQRLDMFLNSWWGIGVWFKIRPITGEFE